jgi:hypothetical protein
MWRFWSMWHFWRFWRFWRFMPIWRFWRIGRASPGDETADANERCIDVQKKKRKLC